jgi:hypothetical protein
MTISKGVSYYGSHFPEHIEKDILEIKSLNCDHIVLAASEFDIEFYTGSVKSSIELAHKHGLKVFLDLWAYGGTFGGEAASFFVMKNPDCCQRSNQGDYLPRACFNNPTFHDFIEKTIIKCLNEFHIDGFFWDEPHFFQSKTEPIWGCSCQVCKNKFMAQFGKEMPDQISSEVIKFRNESCLIFLRKFSKLIKKIKPEIQISICCFPKAKDKHGFDWNEICKIKEIDIFGSDPYWISKNESMDYIDKVSKEVMEVANRHNKKSEIWIQLYKIPAGREDEISEAVEIAAKYKPNYISAWTFRAAQNSILSCGDWKKAWDNLQQAYKRI